MSKLVQITKKHAPRWLAIAFSCYIISGVMCGLEPQLSGHPRIPYKKSSFGEYKEVCKGAWGDALGTACAYVYYPWAKCGTDLHNWSIGFDADRESWDDYMKRENPKLYEEYLKSLEE